MRNLTIALSGLLTTGLAGAATDTYIIEPRHTFPSFEINHLGFSTQRGRFNKTTGTVTLDTTAKTGSIEVTIYTDSIDTGLEALEAKLRSPEFFDAANYPTITYKANQLLFQGDRPVAAAGKISLHGRTKPLQLTIDHFHCGLNPVNLTYQCGGNAVGTLKRTDFGINAFRPVLADEVKIIIQVEAVKQ